MIETIVRIAQSAIGDAARPLDPRVLDAMARIPREVFLPDAGVDDAYADAPFAIGFGQTISQPYIVALMSSLGRIAPTDRVLEVGTGSGYQTAVLAALAGHVHTVEHLADLAARAASALQTLGILNVSARIGDGHEGWPDHAPYDAIVVTAAPAEVPALLLAQLAPGGRLVIPVGAGNQMLTLIEKSEAGLVRQEPIIRVRFVPLVTGKSPP